MKYFRIGIDAIPDWAADAITHNKIIITNDNTTDGLPGAKDNKIMAFVWLPDEEIGVAKHGDIIVENGDDNLIAVLPYICKTTWELRYKLNQALPHIGMITIVAHLSNHNYKNSLEALLAIDNSIVNIPDDSHVRISMVQRNQEKKDARDNYMSVNLSDIIK